MYDSGDRAKTIFFSSTKNELVQLNEGFKSFQRKLKNRWRIQRFVIVHYGYPSQFST